MIKWADSFDYKSTVHLPEEYDIVIGGPTISSVAAQFGTQGLSCGTGAMVGKVGIFPAGTTTGMASCWFAAPNSPTSGGLGIGIMQFNDGSPWTGGGIVARLSRTSWVVSADSAAPGCPASNGVDGDITSIWSSWGGGIESGPGSAYYTINLGSVVTFDAVQITNRPAPQVQGHPKNFDVQTSPDGVTFTRIASFTGPQNNSTNTYTLPGTFSAHYVRIFVHDVWNYPGGNSNVVFSEINLLANTAYQVGLYLNADAQVVAVRGDQATIGTSTSHIPFGSFHHIEAKVVISGTTPLVLVKIDGQVQINATTTTTNFISSQVTGVIWGDWSGGGGINIDSVVAWDNTGATNNDLLGVSIVERIYLNGAGDTTQLTPSGGLNSVDVNDSLPDEDSTYVKPTASGQRDKYNIGNVSLSTGSSIAAVILKARVGTFSTIAHMTQFVVEVVTVGGNLFTTIDAVYGYFDTILENITPVNSHGGQDNLLIRLQNNISIPSDDQWYGLRALSGAAPVSHGKYVAFGGWIRLDEDTKLPTGIDGAQRIGVRFYDSNFNEVQSNMITMTWTGADGVFPMQRWAPSSLVNGYRYLSTDPTVVDGTSGVSFEGPLGPAYVPGNASWVRFECGAFIRNNSGSAFSPGSVAKYIQARFDDCFAVWL